MQKPVAGGTCRFDAWLHPLIVNAAIDEAR